MTVFFDKWLLWVKKNKSTTSDRDFQIQEIANPLNHTLRKIDIFISTIVY